MSTFAWSALAAIMAASTAAPLGWWLRGRHDAVRRAALNARIAGLRHVVAAHQHAAELVTQHAVTAMANLVAMSASLLRTKREQP